MQQEAEKEFEKNIKEHEPLLRKICGLYARTNTDRKDLFQEIVIQLWKAYPKYKGDAQFGTWLYRVAINTAISGYRKVKNTVTTYGQTELLEHVSDDVPTGIENEQMEQMYRAIAQLNEIDKAIVMLYMEDKPYSDMEEILGICQGTLRVKMNRIREKLRQLTKNE